MLQERKVGLREAEHAVHGWPMSVAHQRVSNGSDLAVEPVDELRPIAAIDHQLCLAKQRGRDGNPALVVLGVDDVNAGRRDDEVVNVAATAGHAAVVQQDDAFGGPAPQRLGDRDLSMLAAPESELMLRFALQGQEQAPNVRMCRSRALLTITASAFVLAAGAGARRSRVWTREHRRCRPGRGTHAVQARDGAGLGVPPCSSADRQLCGAHGAAVGPAQGERA